MHQPCVYKTNALQGYRFHTHRNDLIIDRKDSEAVEVIFTVLEPGQKSPLHDHRDCEQLWYVIEGHGRLLIGQEREEHLIGPGDVVLTRRNLLHAVENTGDSILRYLAVDVFVGNKPPDEPTWDAHVAALCRRHGWIVSIVDVQYGQSMNALDPATRQTRGAETGTGPIT
jgi:quercetin dioxygenase-like cupin family protein